MELDPAFPLRFLFLFQEFCTCKEEFVMPQPSGKGDAACSQRPPLSMVRVAMFQGVTICQAGSRHLSQLSSEGGLNFSLFTNTDEGGTQRSGHAQGQQLRMGALDSNSLLSPEPLAVIYTVPVQASLSD